MPTNSVLVSVTTTMSEKFDAIIIGAGVIGAPIAYELSKMGYKTLNVDKLPDAGEGSTAGSCAIVRAHYSTADGVAMAEDLIATGQAGEKLKSFIDFTQLMRGEP